MKLLICFAIILNFSNSFASNINNPDINYILENLNSDFAPEVSCIEEEDPSFKDCSNEKIKWLSKVNDDFNKGYIKLVKQVENYKTLGLSALERKFVSNVRSVLKCVEKKISRKITFTCEDSAVCNDTGFLMYVSRLHIVPNALRSNKVYVCDSAFSYLQKHISGVILHELTHLCGTEDLEYLFSKNYDANPPKLMYNTKVYGSRNADSYAYWFQFGFCIPGRDCY